jgi:hypothetical protein
VLPLEEIKAKLYSTCKRFADNSEWMIRYLLQDDR